MTAWTQFYRRYFPALQFDVDGASSSSSPSQNSHRQGGRGRWTDDEEDSDNIYDDEEDFEIEDDIFDEDNDQIAHQVSIVMHMHVSTSTVAVIRKCL